MDDRSFLAEFESAAIPSERWSHRAHIRMAFLYLRDRPFPEGLARIRSGILALNRANDVQDTPESGYHETVTVAWARIVASTIRVHGPTDDFDSFSEANPHLFNKSLLRLYYTRERILTPEAKAGYVEPDLAPLPRAPGDGATRQPPRTGATE